MAELRHHIGLCAFMLTACGDMTPAEQAQMDALLACTSRLEAAFPDVANVEETESGVDDADPQFKAAPDGHFVWEVKAGPKTPSFTCEGNLTERKIELVEVNGAAKRPQSQEVWKF